MKGVEIMLQLTPHGSHPPRRFTNVGREVLKPTSLINRRQVPPSFPKDSLSHRDESDGSLRYPGYWGIPGKEADPHATRCNRYTFRLASRPYASSPLISAWLFASSYS
jgi:hypothetical protein